MKLCYVSGAKSRECTFTVYLSHRRSDDALTIAIYSFQPGFKVNVYSNKRQNSTLLMLFSMLHWQEVPVIEIF